MLYIGTRETLQEKSNSYPSNVSLKYKLVIILARICTVQTHTSWETSSQKL